MAGAPSQLDLFDPKPALTKHDGQDIPEELIKGERFAFIKGTPKLLASPFAFRRHGQSGAEISELLPHLVEGRRRHRDHPLDADDAVQSRAGADLHEHRPPGDRPAEHGIVAQLRPRQREPRPARVRRAALRREQSRRRQVVLGQRLSADRASGRRVPLGRDPVLFVSNPAGVDADVRRRSIDAINDLNRLHADRRRRSRRSRPASAPTSWPTGCRRACPS